MYDASLLESLLDMDYANMACFIFSPAALAVAHRNSLDFHPGIDIPNGPKFVGALRCPPQCCVLGKEAVALPVESSVTFFILV